MSTHVICSCGHDEMRHHGTTWKCREQNSDGSECKCARLVPMSAYFGGEIYRLVPASATNSSDVETAPPARTALVVLKDFSNFLDDFIEEIDDPWEFKGEKWEAVQKVWGEAEDLIKKSEPENKAGG